MLRITAGQFKGRKIGCPLSSRVRPTGARAREAIFNILGDEVVDASILDLFAGSGLLGFEALSRGAASVVFIDQWIGSIKAIRTTIGQLGVEDKARAIQGSWSLSLQVLEREGKFFDLVLADPPYPFFSARDDGEKLLAALGGCAIVAAGGKLILEYPSQVVLPTLLPDWELDNQRSYGSEGIVFYRRRETEHE